MTNILVCDDERDIVSALKIYLSTQDYRIIEAYNGEEAVAAVKNMDVGLVLLDVMMPKMDGLTALCEIRKNSNVPVILLTAKSEDGDKIMGLGLGADDYVTKPFSPAEVIARVKSQLRRYTQLGSAVVKPGILQNGGIVFDTERCEVTVDGSEISLTPTEYEILKLLIENPGKVFSPSEIYRRVWSDEPIGSDGTIAVHIRHLREKIEIDPSSPRYITVVWGQGYRLEQKKTER